MSKTTLHNASPTRSSDSRVRFEQAAASTLQQFQSSVAALLASMPHDTRRGIDVERALGIDRKLGWQMHRIAHASNPLALAANIPAAVSMKRVLKAAADKKLPAEIIDNVSASFLQVERLVAEHAGDRERFVSMVGPLIKDEADALDLKQKKAAYRAMSHLVGVDTRLYTTCTFVHPTSDPDRVDLCVVWSHLGLHRLRSTSPLFIPLRNARSASSNELSQYADSSQSPIGRGDGTYLLDEFCSAGLEVRDVMGTESMPRAMEIGETVGRKNAIDLVYGAVSRGAMSPFAIDPGPSIFASTTRVHLPAETHIADTLVHRDAFGVNHPIDRTVKVFTDERLGIGSGAMSYAEKASLLSVHEHCEHLGQGVEMLANPESPRHIEMIRFICASLGWNPDDFYVYRCRVEYPIFRSTVRVQFDLPKP